MKREREDAKALALAASIVPTTWLLLLGWSWERCVSAHDALAQSLPLLHRLTQAGGDWSRLLYLPDWLAGSYVRDVVGPFPPFAAFARLGFAPAETLNLTVFLWQVLLAFLGGRLASDLAGLWGGSTTFSWAARVAAAWLCAFSPVLGWRVGYGHLVLMVGAAALMAELALVAAAAAGSTSFVLAAVAASVFHMVSLYSAQQTAFYAAFFGAPVFVGLWLSSGHGLRRLTLPLLIPAASFLAALPRAWGMFARAFGSDAPRLLGSESVTYDFVTSTAADWVASIPWTISSLPAGRPETLLHEVNYPLGPLVVPLLFLPWRRYRAFGFGLAVSLGLVLLFSMNVKPFSSWLLSLVPPLNYFRAPARAMLPLLMALPALAIAATMGAIPRVLPANGGTADQKAPKHKGGGRRSGAAAPGTPWLEPRDAVALPLGLGMLLLPTLPRELAGWALGLIAVPLLRGRFEKRLSAAAVLLALGLASVAAFRERLLPMQNAAALFRDAAAVGEAIRTARPELQSPLARVRLGSDIPAFSVNTAFAAGLSSLEGYHFPTRRFSALIFALRGASYEPSAVFFKTGPEDPAFPVLRQLYDLQWEAGLDDKRQLVITPLGPAPGPAWFSSGLDRVEGFDSLASRLRSEIEGLDRALLRSLLLVGPDPFVVRARLPAELPTSCAEAHVIRVATAEEGVTAEVETSGDCPLTIALNFAEPLVATASFADGRKEAATVFPAYGALTAVWVPGGAREVHVGPTSRQPAWTIACLVLGVTGLAFAFFLAHRESKAPS